VGAAVAASLSDEGLDVAVLEARGVASGATGRAAGLVLTGLSLFYDQAIKWYGREAARALWAWTVDNRARLKSAADRLGVPTERTGSLVLATNAEQAARLSSVSEMLTADGFEVRFEARDPLRRGFAAALHYPDDVAVQVVTLTQRLFETYGIPVHSGTEVYRLEQDGDEVLVWARGRVVRASTVVLAVNAYAPLLDAYFADKIAPARGHILVTRPLDGRLLVPVGQAGPFAFRQNTDGRILFTAWRPEYETPAAGPGDDSAEVDLMRFVGRYFPEAVKQLAQRGSAITGVSRDGLPLLGALPHLPQVFFAVGFGGDGVSLAFAAADLLTGLILGGADPEILSARRLE